MTMRTPAPTSRLELRTRIVDAAAALLREEGVAAVTTRGVAEAAGVQAPTLYRLFGDKDGLLDAVAEHEQARYVSTKAAVGETDDPVADLEAAWRRHIDFGLANPALSALLAEPARAARSPAAVAGLEVLRGRVHRVAVAGRLRVPESRAVQLIHAAGTGALVTLLALPPEARDAALADALYAAVVAAVLTGEPAAGDDATTTAAVTLRAAAAQLPELTPGERGLLAELLDRIAS